MALKTYRELRVWRTAMELAESAYLLTRDFPSSEKFGLSAQIRSAVTSIPANIAEGYGRSHRGDYLHHLSIARGSLMETETHLILAVRLKLVSREQALASWKLSQKVGRMLTKQIRALRQPCRSQTLNPNPQTLATKAEE